MSVRGIARYSTVKGYATPTNAPIYVDSDDNTPKIIPAGSGTTEVALMLGVTASGAKVAAGTGALVTGALTVTTGLTTILNATVSPAAQPTGTGTASMQILVPTWATGALTITAYSVNSNTGGTVAASTSTGTVSWIAIGI